MIVHYSIAVTLSTMLCRRSWVSLSCPTETLHLLNSSFQFPSSPSPETTIQLSAWNQAVFTLLEFAYFHQHNFIHVVVYDRISLLFKAEWYPIVWMDHLAFSLISQWMPWATLTSCATVNNAARNTNVQISFWNTGFKSFGVYTQK